MINWVYWYFDEVFFELLKLFDWMGLMLLVLFEKVLLLKVIFEILVGELVMYLCVVSWGNLGLECVYEICEVVGILVGSFIVVEVYWLVIW